MEWLKFQDTSHDLLAALHPPYSLILWNAATGTKLWKKTYTETLQSFSFDPFEISRLACMLCEYSGLLVSHDLGRAWIKDTCNIKGKF